MGAYALRRVLLVIPTMLGLSVLVFGLARLTPGDPASEYVIRVTGLPPTPEAVTRVRTELGLDRPLPVQYAHWVGRAATGDFGISYATRRPVSAEIARRIRPTLELAVPAAILALGVAVPLGAVSAAFRNRLIDQVARLSAVGGASMPAFWLALLLITSVSVRHQMFPVAGRGGIVSAVLPVLVLAAGPTAVLARFTRSVVLDALGEHYILTARMKGLAERRVLWRHAVRTSMIPVLTAFGTAVGHLLSGTVIVESIFAWPGLGKLALDAIVNRDYPMVQGFVLYAGALFVVVNLLIDLSYGLLDPRIRYDVDEPGGRA